MEIVSVVDEGLGHSSHIVGLGEKALSACSQAGMVNNLNDGLAWGLFPLFFAAHGLSVGRIGVLAALYPAVWGLSQLVTGALSDRWGRKRLIAGGMWTQPAAIGLIAASGSFGWWALGAVLLGAGTAMVYPTLLAAIGDVAHPAWRARSVGVYRLWRDGGFAVGAVVAGMLADVFDIQTAVWAVAALTAASGLVVAVRMYETHLRTPAQPASPTTELPSGSATTAEPAATPADSRREPQIVTIGPTASAPHSQRSTEEVHRHDVQLERRLGLGRMAGDGFHDARRLGLDRRGRGPLGSWHGRDLPGPGTAARRGR